MLELTCPVCGLKGEETEFRYGGEAGTRRPVARPGEPADPAALEGYLYMRDNPRGPVEELWLCRHGCGKWFLASRDTASLAVLGARRLGARDLPGGNGGGS